MRRVSRGLSSLVLCSIVAVTGEASAFCRATTCRPSIESCTLDEHGCNQSGVPLFWKDGAVRLELGSEASPLRGISAEDFELAANAAIDTWRDAACANGKSPSLKIAPLVLVEAPVVEFLDDAENESVVVFRDDAWPHAKNAVAKTNLGFYLRSGELDDADIELNSHEFEFATQSDLGDTDLQAVLTHEIGHALGLDHTDVPGATMMTETTGSSTEALRSLEADDVDAICAAYPPEEEPSEPDEASGGGCAVSRAGAGGRAPSPCALAMAALAWIHMSRRRHRRATGRPRTGRTNGS